jgi:hypothetical protein
MDGWAGGCVGGLGYVKIFYRLPKPIKKSGDRQALVSIGGHYAPMSGCPKKKLQIGRERNKKRLAC